MFSWVLVLIYTVCPSTLDVWKQTTAWACCNRWYSFDADISILIFMITSSTPNSKPAGNNSAKRTSQNRPEIRDNLDSRAGEEQDDKGDDTTHNERETNKDKLKSKK